MNREYLQEYCFDRYNELLLSGKLWTYLADLDEQAQNRLISKILVGEVKKIDGQKVQEVRIVYNFVGEIPEITA